MVGTVGLAGSNGWPVEEEWVNKRGSVLSEGARRLPVSDVLGVESSGGFAMVVAGDGSRALEKGRKGARRRRRAAAGAVAVGLGLGMMLGTAASPALADDVTNVIPVGERPTSIAVNPVTDKAYIVTGEGISILSGSQPDGMIYTDDRPADVAVNPVTNKVYISEVGGSVAVVDGATRASTSVPVGSSPGTIAVNPVTNKIYVGVDNGVTMIDGATLKTTPLPLAGAQEIFVNATTGKVYVLAGGIIKVVGAGGTVTSTINIGAGGILDVAINEQTNKIYFTTLGRYGASIRVIDGITDTVAASVPTTNNVGKVAVNPVTNTIYVAADSTSLDGFVTVIDASTLTQTAELRTPTRIRDIVVNSASNKAYALLGGRGVTVVDGDNTATALFSGQEPSDAAVNPTTGRVYVSNSNSASVSVIDGSVAAPVRNDFNGDSFPDVLARDASGVLWLYPGNGSGGWLQRVQVGQGWNVMTAMIAPGDFNGDSNADLLARDTAGTMWLYPGNGKGGWLPRVQVGQGWEGMSAIEPINFFGNGFGDVVARDRVGTLWLYRGDGKGGWLPRMWVGSGWSGMSEITGAGDFNGDGVTDLVARDSAGALWLYSPTGSSGWLPRQQIGQGWNAVDSLVGPGDFDGDGREDVLARNSSGELWLFSGQGGSAWPTAKRVGTGWGGMTAIL